jgi:hypothetical protein
LAEAERKVDETLSARWLHDDEARHADIASNEASRALDRAVTEAVWADPAREAVLREFFSAGRRCLQMARILMTLNVNVRSRVSADDIGLVLRIGDIARPGSQGGISAFTRDPLWVSALAELRENADAPLPSLPEPEPPGGDAGAGPVASA